MTTLVRVLQDLLLGSHFSGDNKFHVFSRLFPGKCNEIPGQFGFESVFVLIMQIWQRRKLEYFENDILKSETWKTKFTKYSETPE